MARAESAVLQGVGRFVPPTPESGGAEGSQAGAGSRGSPGGAGAPGSKGSLWCGRPRGSAILRQTTGPGSLAVPQGLGSDSTLPEGREPADVCVVDAGRRHKSPGSNAPCREQASCFIGSQRDVRWAQMATGHTGGGGRMVEPGGPPFYLGATRFLWVCPEKCSQNLHPWKECERPSRRQPPTPPPEAHPSASSSTADAPGPKEQ